MSTTEAELFDSTEYVIPFQQADGKDVDEIVVRLGGILKLNRNDPDHVALVESLTLGRNISLTALASVDGKVQSVRYAGDTEIVTHTVALRLHSVEAA